ncbi:MAG TPA: hypothetical protein VNI79_04245 [Sphingomicrobium sp.]|nr:hypothetical protein [Sphingomicrobium sp.]
MPIESRRQSRLARKRRPIDAASFERALLIAGVTPTTARFLWEGLKPFYRHPLTPMPEDRLESVIIIDRPEIEGLVGRFWTAMRGQDFRPQVAPLGDDPSVVELGRYCDLLAGWSIRGRA